MKTGFSFNHVSTEDTLQHNAPDLRIHIGKDTLIQNGLIKESDMFESSLEQVRSFLKNNFTKHPSRDFRISVQRNEKEGVTVSLWWESQNIYIDNALQQHYTKYSPTIILNDKMSKEQVKTIFDVVKNSISPTHPDRARYSYFINAQEETALVLLGIKKAFKTVITDTELVRSNYVRSRVRGEGVVISNTPKVTSTMNAVHRGEVFSEDQKKIDEIQRKIQKSPVDTFSQILEEVDEEIANPSVSATFHESRVKEKRFLSFIISMAAFIRKQGNVAESLWKFYANKFVDMIKNFFGASIFKDGDSSSALRKLWGRIRETAKKLASSPVLDRMLRLTKTPQVKTAPTFEEQAQIIKSRMEEQSTKQARPGGEPKTFEQRAEQVKKQMAERARSKQVVQKTVEESLIVQSTSPEMTNIDMTNLRPKSFWEKTKDTVQGTVKKWFQR